MNRQMQSRLKSGRSIVIIPARGGSKRFPRKNIALLSGRPLLAYSILAARASESVDDVYVSTDDNEIAEIAKGWGALVPFLRESELANDVATNDEVVANFLHCLEPELSEDIDIVVLIQPTSPFVTPDHIDKSIQMLRARRELHSVSTMTLLDHRHHPYNLATCHGQDGWSFIFADVREKSKSRQSKPNFLKFGNLFAARKDTFLSSGRFGNNKAFVLIDELYAWDIDQSWSLQLAETILNERLVALPHLDGTSAM